MPSLACQEKVLRKLVIYNLTANNRWEELASIVLPLELYIYPAVDDGLCGSLKLDRMPFSPLNVVTVSPSFTSCPVVSLINLAMFTSVVLISISIVTFSTHPVNNYFILFCPLTLLPYCVILAPRIMPPSIAE